MKKRDIKRMMRELWSEVEHERSSPVEKDSKGRRKRPKKKDKGFFFYCNKADLDEFRRICDDILHKNYSKVLREKVTRVLKDAGVEPKDTG